MVFNSLFSIFAFDYFFLLYFPYTIIPRLNFSKTFNYWSFLFLSNFLHRLFPFHFRSAFLRFFQAPISLSFFRFHVYFLRFISFILSSPLTYFFAFLLRPLVQSSSNSSIFFDFFSLAFLVSIPVFSPYFFFYFLFSLSSPAFSLFPPPLIFTLKLSCIPLWFLSFTSLPPAVILSSSTLPPPGAFRWFPAAIGFILAAVAATPSPKAAFLFQRHALSNRLSFADLIWADLIRFTRLPRTHFLGWVHLGGRSVLAYMW